MQSPSSRPSSTARGYGPEWRKESRAYLKANPWCVMCQQRGLRTLATTVDHILPHRGDQRLFWDSAKNWQSLCGPCHNSAKQKLEKSGKLVGCDVDGNPLDPNHFWRKA